MALVDYALQYASRSWCVFGLAPRSKLPLISKKNGGKGFLDATADLGQIERWWSATPQANIGLSTGASGLVVLDVDGPEGLIQLEAVARSYGAWPLPRTLTAKTGRDGGLHLYYRGTGVRSSQVKGEHLDVRGSSGYVVLPPSVHPSGALYQWIDASIPLADAPAWVALWVSSRKGSARQAAPPSAGLVDLKVNAARDPARPGRGLAARSVANLTATAVPFTKAEANRLRSALAVIDAAIDGATWFSFGAALHDLKWIVNGTDYGLEIWDEWSRTSKGDPLVAGDGGYKGRADLEKRWAGFNRDYQGSRATVASIYKAAMDLGWAQEATPEKVNGHASLPQFAEQFNQAAPEFAGQVPGNPLIELNQHYQTIGDLGGKCMVMSWVSSKADSAVKIPSFQTFKSFHERYAHRYVKVEDKMRPIGAYWTSWPHRRSFEGLDLVPGAPAVLPGNVLNLWTGFAVEPAAGEWTLMRRHIGFVLAGGDRASAEYILRFAAWCVQNPGQRAEAALVFRGGKGSGKGTFANALRKIFGQHGLHVSHQKHLIGSFNAHMRNCLLLYADEAFWAGDKQGEATLKAIITEPVMMIEQKGVDATQWENRLHLLMTANAEWAVPASHDERRYAVFDVAPDQIGNQAYFDALHNEVATGGLAAMLHDLLHFDLGDWHPRQIIRTAALQLQKARSLPPIAEWWESVLQNGWMPFLKTHPGNVETDEVTSTALLNMMRDFAPRAIDANATRIGRFVGDMGGERLHRRNGNQWRLKPLLEHRAHWENKYGKWNWDNEAKNWNSD